MHILSVCEYVIKPLIDYIFDLVSSPADTKSDPSGYVYEAVESNRVEGVTARVFYRDEEGYAVFWSEAADFDEVNPQRTDELGLYGWDVPTGSWRVEFSKDGYETFTTAFLPVPPPQTEVNVGIISELPSEIISAEMNDNRVKIEFSRYMKAETVTNALTVNGTSVTFEPLNAEPAAADPEQMLATFFIASVAIDGDTAVMELMESAESYAGIKSRPAVYTVESSLQP